MAIIATKIYSRDGNIKEINVVNGNQTTQFANEAAYNRYIFFLADMLKNADLSKLGYIEIDEAKGTIREYSIESC